MELIKTFPDEEALEELFKDRFTENDAKYMDIKSNNSPISPPVVYPWKIPGRVFHKKWDYGSGQQDRGHSRYDNDRTRYDSGRNRYDGDRHRSNSHQSYRDRSGDRERHSNRGERDRSRESSSTQNRSEKNNSRDHDKYNERNRH